MSDTIDKTFDFAKAIEELEEINHWFQNEVDILILRQRNTGQEQHNAHGLLR